NALSGESNGVACLYLKGNSPIAEEFNRLNSQAKHTPHPLAPDVLVMPAVVADSFLHARDVLFAPGSAFTLDRKQLVVNCIREALNCHLVPEPSPSPVGCDKRSAVAPGRGGTWCDGASLVTPYASDASRNSVAGLQWMELALSRLLSVRVANKCMIDVGAHCGTSLQPFVEMGWS